ncbi:hypothetical protein [Scytonema sp. NUACC26]|uniref:hypothetical protein n=1 Tax=Scytonema sp. NUACC26 TaxID=3140176 RepID=UPI0034DCA57C
MITKENKPGFIIAGILLAGYGLYWVNLLIHRQTAITQIEAEYEKCMLDGSLIIGSLKASTLCGLSKHNQLVEIGEDGIYPGHKGKTFKVFCYGNNNPKCQ